MANQHGAAALILSHEVSVQAAGRTAEVACRGRSSGWHGAMQSKTCLPTYVGSPGRILAFAQSLFDTFRKHDEDSPDAPS